MPRLFFSFLIKMFLKDLFLFYAYGCLAYMYVCVPYTCPTLANARESPGTGVTRDCETLCGCGELRPDPLKERQVLLTNESSLQLLGS